MVVLIPKNLLRFPIVPEVCEKTKKSDKTKKYPRLARIEQFRDAGHRRGSVQEVKKLSLFFSPLEPVLSVVEGGEGTGEGEKNFPYLSLFLSFFCLPAGRQNNKHIRHPEYPAPFAKDAGCIEGQT